MIISTHCSRSCLLIPLLHLWWTTLLHSQLFVILSFSQSLTFWFRRHRKIKKAHKWGCVQSWMTNHKRVGACPGLLVNPKQAVRERAWPAPSAHKADTCVCINDNFWLSACVFMTCSCLYPLPYVEFVRAKMNLHCKERESVYIGPKYYAIFFHPWLMVVGRKGANYTQKCEWGGLWTYTF